MILMPEIPVSIQASLDRFIALAQQWVEIESVYVYGSHAKGTATKWSDIDVAVISPAFAPDIFQARVWLLGLAAQVDDRIEPTPFTPQDFTPNDPLVSEIQRFGARWL